MCLRTLKCISWNSSELPHWNYSLRLSPFQMCFCNKLFFAFQWSTLLTALSFKINLIYLVGFWNAHKDTCEAAWRYCGGKVHPLLLPAFGQCQGSLWEPNFQELKPHSAKRFSFTPISRPAFRCLLLQPHTSMAVKRMEYLSKIYSPLFFHTNSWKSSLYSLCIVTFPACDYPSAYFWGFTGHCSELFA